jgi:hypothetical protein
MLESICLKGLNNAIQTKFPDNFVFERRCKHVKMEVQYL